MITHTQCVFEKAKKTNHTRFGLIYSIVFLMRNTFKHQWASNTKTKQIELGRKFKCKQIGIFLECTNKSIARVHFDIINNVDIRGKIFVIMYYPIFRPYVF